MNRKKLYGFLLLACTAGYAWLGYSFATEGNHSVGVCLIKETSGLPCPSCGTTRSIIALVGGDFSQALYMNPLGIIVLLIMLVSPVWIGLDLILGKQSLFNTYQNIEAKIRLPRVAIPLASLMVLNWIWNIYKGL